VVEVRIFFISDQCYSYSAPRQHNNTNPVTNESLAPADLISLHHAQKPSGEYHDPISFKPFSEHSHIVAIATTGNVFLAESVKGGVDLVNDVRFKKCVPSASSLI
jgi:peptidyl-prolyl cis-trans isomerase-like 2